MRITAFGIHPDDIELGCGGTVALCRRLGYTVVLVDLTRGEAATNGTPELRATEAGVAAAILGCERRLNAALPDTGVRSESESQQRIVAGIIRSERPDIVFLPTADDPHPDHISGSALITRAMALAGIRGYATDGGEEAWGDMKTLVYGVRRETRPDVVVDISETFADKCRAIEAHTSQFVRGPESAPTAINSKPFLDMIIARDRLNGQRIGVEYGEGFSTLNPIALRTLDVFKTGRQ